MTSYGGTTALVTGASKGIGKALAEELGRRGTNLVLVARSGDALERMADRMREGHHVGVEVIVADLGDVDGPLYIADQLSQRGIEVDLLLNNAGIGSVGPFLDRPLDQQIQSVQVNVSGLLTLTYLLGQRMRAGGRGAIINVASTAAFQPMPYQASYAATKAFLLSFSEALAEELAGSGIRVMTAHPGPVDTGFFDGTTASMNNDADSPELIAKQILDDFDEGKHASYPGHRRNRWHSWASRFLPRRRVSALTARMNRAAGFDQVSDVAPDIR